MTKPKTHQKPEHFTPYKVKSLRTYSLDEWFAYGEKYYQNVFEASEVDYIWIEVGLYNKLFDEEDWILKGELVCYQYKGTIGEREELCRIHLNRNVRADENITWIREGWGNIQRGAYWKPGTYAWELLIDGKVIGTHFFYILNGVKELDIPITPVQNPYFILANLYLYEAPSTNSIARKPLKTFSQSETRYVWACLELENRLFQQKEKINRIANYIRDGQFPLEFQFLFYSYTGMLKGKVSRTIILSHEDERVECEMGWGADSPGTWFPGQYLLQVVFMGRIIASAPFEVGNRMVPASQPLWYIPTETNLWKPLEVKSQKFPSLPTDVDITQAFDDLIGLEELKETLREYVNYIRFLMVRQKKGLEKDTRINLHAAFLGNPGTGKTTVAKRLAHIYHALGLLSKGHLVEVDRSNLVGEYIGQTAPKVKEVIEQARGGVLFIDEAYSLVRDPSDTKDFGREVVEILIKEMSDGPGDLAIIVAGYPKEMETFLNSNPGLKSRFDRIFYFPDYTPEELQQIARLIAKKRQVELTEDAWQLIDLEITRAYRNRDASFGNARFVISLIDSAKIELASRLAKTCNFEELDEITLSTITKADVEAIFKKQKPPVVSIPIDEDVLHEGLQELKSLIGLEKVKEEVEELVELIRFYRSLQKNLQKEFPLHSIFLGNPGTGKTSVARILAKIFRGLGILERGHLIETDRSGLVAAYLGQTALKTNEVVDQALGGVLFIDEAYSLYLGEQDTYGKEAIATLLKRMEDNRGQFIVIAAGYPEEMKEFLKANPGLRSRFDKIFHFEDYTPEQLLLIAKQMLQKEALILDPSAESHLVSYLNKMYITRNRYFGNARAVRQIIENAIKKHFLRLAQIKDSKLRDHIAGKITAEDIREFITETDGIQSNQRGIGFIISKHMDT